MLEYLHRTFAANPLFGRQLATHFSGPRLGFAFILVNLTLFFTYMFLFIYFMEDGTLFTNDEAIPLAYFWHNTTLYFLLVILLPIKVSGFIEGPRVNRSFDQIVVTGASPLSFFFGAWFSGMAYSAVLLLVSLPYLGCLYLISGEMGIARFASGYGVLFLYSNVVILVTLAMAVLGREWGTVPLCIFFFILAGIFGLIIEPDWIWGYPIHIAEVTPTRLFWRQTEPFYLWRWNLDRTRALIHADPVLFSTAIPLDLYSPVLWTGLAAVSIAIIVLGPAHRFSAGLNNFGTAVLPGDRKRRFFRRLRGGLTRRVELAFFYENRAPWVDRWGALFRFLLSFLPVILVWGVILGRAYGGYPVPYGRRGFYGDEILHVVTILSGIVLFLWVLYYCDARHQVYQKVKLGRLLVPRELMLYVSFAILLSALFLVHYSTLSAMQTNYAISRDHFQRIENLAEQQQQAGSVVETISASIPMDFRPSDIVSEEVYARYIQDWWVYIPGFLLLLANLFLMTRVLTRFTQAVLLARFLALACTLGVVFLPMIVLAMVFEGYLPASWVRLGGLSPFILVDEVFARPLEFDRAALYFTTQIVFGGSLVVLLGTLHFLAWRKSQRLATKLERPPPRSGLAAASLILFLGLLSPLAVRAQEATPGATAGGGKDGSGDAGRAPALDLVIEQVVRGFQGSVFSDNVDFYTAIVRNESERTIRGRYWVRDESFNLGWEGDKHEFELGPATTKIFRWGQSASQERYRYGSRTGASRVVFEAEGRILQSRQLQLTPQGQPNVGNSVEQQREGRFLLVAPRHVVVAKVWADAAMSGNSGNAKSCAVEFLPERAGFYLGLDAVVIGPGDHEWTRRQREALHDYVRLGGSVILHGDVARSGLLAAGSWEDLFRGSRSRDLKLDSLLIQLEEQEEGRDVFHVEDGAGASIPLVNVRSVGAGHVSHVGFSLERPPARFQTANFWPALDRALPRSRFPLIPTNPMWWADRTLDLSALFLILGYFLAYSLLFGGSLVFFFRRRRRRGILWAVVAGVPLLFLAFVPALNVYMHSRPSLTETRDLAFFGPGSSRGVTMSQLTVRSSGRQRQEIEFSGRELALIPFTPWATRRYYYNAALPDLDYGSSAFELLPRPGARGDYDLVLETVPWTSRALEVFGTMKLDRAVESRADLYCATGKLAFEVQLPFDLPVEQSFLLLHGFHSEHVIQQVPVELEPARSGLLKGTLTMEKTFLAVSPQRQRGRAPASQSYLRSMQAIVIPGGLNLTWNLRARRRVFLAVAPAPGVAMGLEMRSEDVAFEKPASPGAYQSLRADPAWHRGRIENRGEGYIRNLRYRLFVFELPLEER